jgi:hypothetical protein
MEGGRMSTKTKGPGEGKASSKTDNKPELVPPDGGWGWFVVVAYALSNVSLILKLFHGAYHLQMSWIIRLRNMFMKGKDKVAFERTCCCCCC